MQEFIRDYLNPIFEILNYNLFALGDAKITPLSILYVLLLAIALIYLSSKLKNLLITSLLARTRLDLGAQQAIGTITRYVVLFVGTLIIFQTVGIDLTTLNVLAGAIGIGIGFGLQNIANNFISGLILLIERPIKAGDRVEIDDVNGEVVSIGARSTTIRTNDAIAIIVPNSKFISENVINWSFGGEIIRFKIPVGVACDSDIDLVTEILLKIAEENEDVAETPPPSVRLVELGTSALIFELRAWSRAKLHRPGHFRSGINYEIVRKFRQHGIEMPFPQSDIHIKSGGSNFEN
ncbi:MAG: mechanosensitive ion channel domain-containing protein [Pyrinomonadaceae bacterium]